MDFIITFNILLLFRIFVAGKTEGINLNFQQNDYQIEFKRVELIQYNKNIVKELSINTFKYNRTIAVSNITFAFKIDLGNDIEVITQAYKFMSNEYRHFPLRFQSNGCKAIKANVAGMQTAFLKCGNFTGCPLLKGIKYHICNWYPDPSKFPPFVPNGEYKVEMQMLHSSQEISVIAGYATIFRPTV